MSNVDSLVSSQRFYFSLGIAAAAAKSLQSCPTLCDPIDGSPPGSPVPGIQARRLEWAAIAFSVCQGYSLHLSYPLLPPPCPQVPPVYLHLYYCPANINRFISTIFLDFSLCIYGNMIFYMIFLFFWLILYDRFWVHPHHLYSFSREQPSWMVWLYSWALIGCQHSAQDAMCIVSLYFSDHMLPAHFNF